jgi:ABC-type sugar transport system permease subunit
MIPALHIIKRRLERNFIGYSFTLPFIILFSVFVLYPIVSGLLLSSTDYTLMKPQSSFVGLKNYIKLITEDNYFRKYFINTIYYTVLVVPARLLLGLFLANYVNRRMIGFSFSRVIIFAPYVLSVSVIGLVWGWLYDWQYGLINTTLKFIGLSPIPWLSTSQTVMPALALVSLWADVGFDMIILLAAMQDIPTEVIEAAKVDGANGWQSFWQITVPLLRPVIIMLITINIISCMRLFGLVFVMTDGGPAGSSMSVAYHIYRTAFRQGDFSYGSAMGFILMAFLLVITIIRQLLIRSDTAT